MVACRCAEDERTQLQRLYIFALRFYTTRRAADQRRVTYSILSDAGGKTQLCDHAATNCLTHIFSPCAPLWVKGAGEFSGWQHNWILHYLAGLPFSLWAQTADRLNLFLLKWLFKKESFYALNLKYNTICNAKKKNSVASWHDRAKID